MIELIFVLAQQVAPTWVILAGGLITSGVITAVLNFWFNKRKTSSETEKIDADAADVIQRAAGELITKVQEQAALTAKIAHVENEKLMQQNADLMAQVQSLRVEMDRLPELEASVKELVRGVAMLTAQLREHEIRPIYTPPPDFKLKV